LPCAFSLVSSPQLSSLSRDAQASRKAFESQGILFQKGYRSIKVGVVGRSGSG